MSTWDKSDREVWKNSEIMQELEKKVLASMFELERELKKKANIKQTTQDVKDLGAAAPAAADGVERVADAVKKLEGSAEDDLENNLSEGQEEEIEKAADELIDALTKLSYDLADRGDTVLAYKVERVIRDIESGFVDNED